MALEVQVKINRSAEEALAWERWSTKSYTKDSRQRLPLLSGVKTEVKHNLSNIAFMFIVKATTDSEVISVFKDSEAGTSVSFDDMFAVMGLSFTTLELQASGDTTLDVFVAGT